MQSFINFSKNPIKMKRYLTLFLSFFLGLSCEEDENPVKNGKLELTFSVDGSVSGGRVKETVTSLLVSIQDADGNFVHEKRKITLYQFGEEYLSEPIALTTGSYNLVEFVVLDENDDALYATPVEGSPLDYLVDDPLPIGFSITKDATTKVSPQVIKIEGHSSADFGYTTFGLSVVNTFTFTAGILAYDPTTQNFELTSAHMQITSGDITLFDMDLEGITNDIRIRDGFETYTVIVTKANHGTYEHTFTAEELKSHVSGSPLVITLLGQNLGEGLIAYYPFTGDANDHSSNEFHGIVHEATLTSDRHGHANTSYSFDGLNDYIQVPHDEALNLESDFTISLWTLVASDQEPHEGINDILRKWTGNAEGYPFSISYLNPLAADENEDKILFARYDGQICSDIFQTHSQTITNDVFIHVAMIKDGGTIRTYINNELVSEVADPMTCTTGNTADMTIGCRGNLVRFFKGKIDDIRIYNRALSADEISELASE